jgi:hypothetical protein
METEGSLSCSKSHLLVPILGQINLVDTTQSYDSMIHFNIILPHT